MKTSTRIVATLAASAAVALAGIAFAHPESGPGADWPMGRGPGMGMGMGMGPGMGMGHGMGMGMGMGPGWGPMGGPGAGGAPGADPAAAAARLAALKEQLKITPAQEPAWQAFASALNSGQAAWDAQRKARSELFGVLTPEQLARVGGGPGHGGRPHR